MDKRQMAKPGVVYPLRALSRSTAKRRSTDTCSSHAPGARGARARNQAFGVDFRTALMQFTAPVNTLAR